MRVPYALSVSGDEEIEAVVKVLRSSTLPGPNVQEFEEKISRLFGKKRGVMVNSGSSALLLGIAAMDLPKGSEVITPALTFSTTIASQIQNGLVPSFVDVDPHTLNIRIDQIEAMITPNTKAMVVPNLMGNIPDWDALRAIADKHKLKVLEDSADTLDSKLHGRPTGERADVCTTSFYGAHIINCAGNGGMLCTNDEELERRARILRGWGRRSSVFAESESANARFGIEIDGIPYDAKYVFDMIGYNFEPSELGAAFGLVQHGRLPGFLKSRQATFDRHKAFFKQYEEFFLLPDNDPRRRYHLVCLPARRERQRSLQAQRNADVFRGKRNSDATGLYRQHPQATRFQDHCAPRKPKRIPRGGPCHTWRYCYRLPPRPERRANHACL